MSEHQNIEYKAVWKDEYLKSICGFANSGGGKLYIGVDDNGKISGIDNSKELLEQLPNKFRDLLGIYAEINLLEEKDSSCLEIIVTPYEIPISYKSRYYFRSGSTTQELKGGVLNDFILKKMGKSWDSQTESDFSIDHIDSQAIEKFKNLP